MCICCGCVVCVWFYEVRKASKLLHTMLNIQMFGTTAAKVNRRRIKNCWYEYDENSKCIRNLYRTTIVRLLCMFLYDCIERKSVNVASALTHWNWVKCLFFSMLFVFLFFVLSVVLLAVNHDFVSLIATFAWLIYTCIYISCVCALQCQCVCVRICAIILFQMLCAERQTL